MIKIPEEVKAEFSARINQALKSSDWAYATQKELAEALHVTPSQVSNYLTGQRLPSLQVARTFCDLTGTNLEWLLTGQAPRGNRDLFQAWAQASDAERASFLLKLAKASITK